MGPGGAPGAGDSQAVADAHADGTGRSPTEESSSGIAQALPGRGLRALGTRPPPAGLGPSLPALQVIAVLTSSMGGMQRSEGPGGVSEVETSVSG